MRKLVVAGLVCVLGACALVGLVRQDQRPAATPDGNATAGSIPYAELAAAREPSSRTSGSMARVDVDAGRAVAVEPGLIAMLEAVARAEARGHDREMEVLLTALIGRIDRLRGILDLLESGGIAENHLARRGAVATLVSAAARWSRGGGPPGLDGPAFVVEMLQRLPRQSAEDRALLVAFLSGTELGSNAVIGANQLEVVLGLCRDFPEDAALYAQLLAGLPGDPAELEPHRATLLAALAGDGPPALTGVLLRALLALDPLVAADAAEELLRSRPDDAMLRTVVAEALASAASPERAVDALLKLKDTGQFGAFAALSDRPETREVVRDRYNALVAANLDGRGRRVLVATMRNEETPLLLGIGATDPSPEVRQQAFLTVTLTRDVGTEGVQALRDAYARRSDPRNGLGARGALIAVGNVLIHTAGPAREDALRFLGDIARDPSVRLDDRRMALQRMRAHVPADSIADLVHLDADDEAQAGK